MERPVIEHKHTKGEWRAIPFGFSKDGANKVVSFKEDGNINRHICTCSNIHDGTVHVSVKESESNARLISIAPKLLQIAEMYFDSMQGTEAEGSLPYQVTLETLNKLK